MQGRVSHKPQTGAPITPVLLSSLPASRRPSGELQEGNKQSGGPYWSAWLEPTRAREQGARPRLA